MEHHFNTQVAQDYDIESAIILHNFFYWIDHNRANNTNFHDGRYWTYNSNDAFVELFPYMNKTKIQRTLKKLADDGIIIKGNYNKVKFDHTAWYAFSDKGLEYMISVGYGAKSAIHNDSTDDSFCNNRKCQSEPTIPNSKPYSKTNNNHKESKENNPLPNFESFKNGTKELSSVEAESRLQDKKEKNSAKRERSGAPFNIEEVHDYFKQKGFRADEFKFWNYYQARGWEGIKDWKALADLWESREKGEKPQPRGEKKRDSEYEEFIKKMEER